LPALTVRRRIGALAAGLALAAAGAALAQPYGYYPDSSADYAYRYAPPRAYDYDGRYTPYAYSNGYDGYNGYGDDALPSPAGGVLLGALLAPEVLGHAPFDEYGADPNGMVAADGHRIKCKLADAWDGYRNAYVRRRQCW
jgi:hypothetical protein